MMVNIYAANALAIILQSFFNNDNLRSYYVVFSRRFEGTVVLIFRSIMG